MDETFNLNKFITTLITAITALYILYKWSTRNFKYWEERGVPYLKPTPFVGNYWRMITFRAQIGHFFAELYNQFTTPYFGVFILNKPNLVIRSPDLVKQILVKDFQYFFDRALYSDEKSDPMGSKFLFLVRNPEWKVSRNRLAPAFSTGKLKNMMLLMNKVADDLKEYLEKNAHNDFIEAKEVFAKFATDVIASCAFGIEANSFKAEDAEFRAIGRLIFDDRWKTHIGQTFAFLIPEVVRAFRIPFFDPVFTNFMREVFWETFNDRKRSKVKRNDLIDMVIQMKEKNKPGEPFEFEGDRVVALAGQLFAAGFESVSSTMAFTLYELCLQPDIQNKVRQEIKYVLSKHGALTYEALKDMKYLDMIINESLRKFPTLPFIDRICAEDYKIPDGDFVIEKGTPVFIPVFGLHYDPEYFPDPDKFIPERFSDENKGSFPEHAFIPFGKGPKSCIGSRFGFLTSKLGVAHVLSVFEVVKAANTPVPLEYESKGFLIASKHPLAIKFRKL